MKMDDRQNLELIVDHLRHMRFVHPNSDIIALAARNGVRARIDALLARAREVDRLEKRIAELCKDGGFMVIRRLESRAIAAETEITRLRAVVEKQKEAIGELLDCDPFIISLGADNNYCVSFRGAQQPTFALFNRMRNLLAETAPDVPADHDGSAG